MEKTRQQTGMPPGTFKQDYEYGSPIAASAPTGIAPQIMTHSTHVREQGPITTETALPQ